MKNTFAYAFLIVFTTLVFTFVLKGFSGNPTAADLMSSTEYSLRDRGRYLLTENLVQNHTFALTRAQADIAAPDVGYAKGKWYELYPPGLSVLAVPFYLIGLKFGMSLVFSFGMGALFSLGTILFVYLITRKIFNLPIWASIFAGITFGFASTSLGYATSLFQHGATGFFIVSSFYAVYKYKQQQKWSFCWASYVWLSYAVMIFIDYPNGILMLPVMVYFLWVSLDFRREGEKYKIKLRSAIILTSIIFIALTLLHGYYNYVNFGSWTKLSGSLAGYREGLQKDLDQGNSTGVNQLITTAQTQKDPVAFFKENKIVTGVNVLLFSSERGLFVYSSIFILGVLGLLYAFRKIDLEKGILASVIGITLLFYSSWGDPYAGYAFGPRYLIPIMPILAIFVSYFITTVRYKFLAKLSAFILYGISSAISVLGAVTTNAVPPRVEGGTSKFGLGFNLDFLKIGKTSSFAYNEFFHQFMTLKEYYFCLLGLVLVLGFIVIFVFSYIEERKNAIRNINK